MSILTPQQFEMLLPLACAWAAEQERLNERFFESRNVLEVFVFLPQGQLFSAVGKHGLIDGSLGRNGRHYDVTEHTETRHEPYRRRRGPWRHDLVIVAAKPGHESND